MFLFGKFTQVKNNTMNMSELISKIKNTQPIENLKEILGEELGALIYLLIDETEKFESNFNYADELYKENEALKKLLEGSIEILKVLFLNTSIKT